MTGEKRPLILTPQGDNYREISKLDRANPFTRDYLMPLSSANPLEIYHEEPIHEGKFKGVGLTREYLAIEGNNPFNIIHKGIEQVLKDLNKSNQFPEIISVKATREETENGRGYRLTIQELEKLSS